MNTSLVKKWVQELRSGKYEQGFGVLRSRQDNVDKFCCLGVLCDVAGTGWTIDKGREFYRAEGNTCYLPDSLASRAGVEKAFQYELTRLNDRRVSFNTIADVIEDRLLGDISD